MTLDEMIYDLQEIREKLGDGSASMRVERRRSKRSKGWCCIHGVQSLAFVGSPQLVELSEVVIRVDSFEGHSEKKAA